MNRAALEHLIRAASAVTNEYEIIVVGSQSVLGAVPHAPEDLLLSMEADMYPRRDPSLADLIDGAIGESSPFHDRFGYYAQGVGPETALLPDGWEDRLVRVQSDGTDLRIGWCLEPHDLAASKLAAGREKDWPFVESMLRHGIVQADELVSRIDGLPVAPEQIRRLHKWLAAVEGTVNGGQHRHGPSMP